MHDASTLMILRLIHIIAGVFWVGAVLFVAGFLMPALRAIGPGAGPVMEQIGQVRKLPLYMMAATILTILSGVGLYWSASGGFQPAWMHSGPGTVFGIGGALAIVGAVVGMAVNSPTGRRLGVLGATIGARGGPPSPAEMAEMQRLQARLASSTRLVALLIVLATAAMAVARYVP
jgi:uncharacterized membrane protein